MLEFIHFIGKMLQYYIKTKTNCLLFKYLKYFVYNCKLKKYSTEFLGTLVVITIRPGMITTITTAIVVISMKLTFIGEMSPVYRKHKDHIPLTS